MLPPGGDVEVGGEALAAAEVAERDVVEVGDLHGHVGFDDVADDVEPAALPVGVVDSVTKLVGQPVLSSSTVEANG